MTTEIKTVGELINELQKYPLETPVMVYDTEYENYGPVSVDLIQDRWDNEPEWPFRYKKFVAQIVRIL